MLNESKIINCDGPVILITCFYDLCLVVQSCPILWDPVDCSPPGSSVHGDSLGKNTRVGCHDLLQGIFPAQGSNPGLLHCRQILYWQSHQGLEISNFFDTWTSFKGEVGILQLFYLLNIYQVCCPLEVLDLRSGSWGLWWLWESMATWKCELWGIMV